MSLEDRVREVFAPAGLLSRTVQEFKSRDGQTEMAGSIARTIDGGGVLVVEAGTGIGKTFAYLVPVLLSGTRVLLSTATKTLQDQLFGRDLPLLLGALSLPLRSALLKGRGSYLCLQRLQVARQQHNIAAYGALRTLAKIESWALLTSTGDLAELPGLDERSPLIALVTSTRENCLGAQCPQFRACHVNQARREALAADVVVVNHHLFFADLAVRESGMAELLPTVRTVVFDEAHQLNETGVQFLGKQLSTGQLLDFARDLLASGLQHARGLADWQMIASAVERAARDLRLLVGKSLSGSKLRWVGLAPELLDEAQWQEGLLAVKASCSQAADALSAVGQAEPDLARLCERASGLVERIDFFGALCAEESVRWLDVGSQLILVESPLDIAQTVRTRLLSSSSEPLSQRSWIFTSATLGEDARLRWFTESCGLTEAEILKVQSPFDYERQAAVYVPMQLARPGAPEHSLQVAELVAKAAAAIGGRTLVLTTTLRALRTVSEALQRKFATANSLEILVQGQQSKRQLMDRFRLGAEGGRAGCVLVASASFWEGFDVPGDALQLLVIDKLPFPPPNDPLVEARSKRLEADGRSVFNDYFIPEAAVALKQGAGRLIRRETDQGVLVICDTRLAQMGYGKRLLAALPAMKKLDSEQEFAQALNALTRTSTTDSDWS